MKKTALFTLLFLGSLTQAMGGKLSTYERERAIILKHPQHAVCLRASTLVFDTIEEKAKGKNARERAGAGLYLMLEDASEPSGLAPECAPQEWKYILDCTSILLKHGADVNFTRRYNGPTVLDLLYEAYGENPSADIAPIFGLLKNHGAKRGTELEKAKAVADRVEEKS